MQKEHFLKKTVIVCLLAMICCVLWGSAFPGIKIGYKLWNIDIKDMASQIVLDRKSTRLNSSHDRQSRMPSSA